MSPPRIRLLPAAIALLTVGLSGVAAANPTLTKGTWKELTPAGVKTGAPETCIGQGLAIDPKSPSTIFWGTTPYTVEAGGLFKSTNGGETWKRVATVKPLYDGASDHLDMPLHVRIDPADSMHLYAGDGVRGSSQGFYVSHDGGESFVLPPGFVAVLKSAGIDNQDIYDVAVDPTSFAHVLVSFHYRWGWTDTKWNMNSGVLESKDGGDTWSVHDPVGTWGSGHAVKFLYEPSLCLGDSNTWLVATQGNGFWRTIDAGGHWTQVSKTNISHGGGTIYYTRAGVLYASGAEASMRSMDNGATWTSVGPNSTWAVHGDGTTLYTGKSFGANQPFSVSPETDGVTWKPFNTQMFPDGPYEMAYDAQNGILYSSNWSSGVWALKVGDGGAPPPASGACPPGGAAGTGGGVAGTGGGAAGTGGGAAGTGGGVAGTGGGAGSGAPAVTGGEGGCACDVSAAGRSRPSLLFSVLGLGLLLSRRRRAIWEKMSRPPS